MVDDINKKECEYHWKIVPVLEYFKALRRDFLDVNVSLVKRNANLASDLGCKAVKVWDVP